MLKIFFFSPYDLPSAHISRNFDYAQRLASRGHSVTVIVNNYSHRTGQRVVKNKVKTFYIESKHNDVDVIWLNTIEYKNSTIKRVLNGFHYLFLSVRYALLNKLRADFAIGDSVPPTAGLSAYFAAKLAKTKFVYQIRDIWPEELVALGAIKRWGIAYIALRLIEKYLYRKADIICTALPDIYEHIKHSGGDTNKIIYIPNGVDTTLMNYSPPNKDSAAFKVVYAGGFGLAHDIESIIFAAQIVESKNLGIKFELYGGGAKFHRAEYLIDKLILRNLQLMGFIDKKKLNLVLSEADVFVSAIIDADNFKFGMNLNKVYDYLSKGRPIISAAKVKKSLVTDAGCGFDVSAGCPQEIADAIIKIFNMTLEERIRLGENARKSAVESYDIDMLACKFERMLLEARP